VLLVSYESSCNGADSAGGAFVGATADEQIAFDTATDTTSGNKSGTLTVNIPPNGRVAHYRFDSDPPVDVAGGDDPTNNGATFTSTGGFYRGAFDFDGADDYIGFPTVSADYSGSADWTTSMWINPDSLPSSKSDRAYVLWHPRADSDVWIGIDDGSDRSDEILFTVYDGSNENFLLSGETPTTGEWTHVAVVSDTTEAGGNGQYKIYVDGTLKSQTDLPNPSGTSGQNAIGAQVASFANPGRWWFDGKIDDVRMYDRALSTSEIESLSG
jgi:hypothetical protein